MNRLLIGLVFSTGCSAALLERMSTERFTGKETVPFTDERVVSADYNRFGQPSGPLGITKSLAVHNPTGFEIEAFLSCGSMYQADFSMVVKAHTTKWQFIGANNNQDRDNACTLVDWKPNYAKALSEIK